MSKHRPESEPQTVLDEHALPHDENMVIQTIANDGSTYRIITDLISSYEANTAPTRTLLWEVINFLFRKKIYYVRLTGQWDNTYEKAHELNWELIGAEILRYVLDDDRRFADHLLCYNNKQREYSRPEILWKTPSAAPNEEKVADAIVSDESAMVAMTHIRQSHASEPRQANENAAGNLRYKLHNYILNRSMHFTRLAGLVHEDAPANAKAATINWQLVTSLVVKKLETIPLPSEFSELARKMHEEQREATNITEEELGETPMSDNTAKTQTCAVEIPKVYETRHYVDGQDVRHMSDDQMIAAICRLEAEIKSLKAIETESKVVAKKIAKAEKGIKFIVKHLDKRA